MLPLNDYYLLDYIEASGGQWLDSQYYTNSTTKIEVKFQYTAATRDTRILGVNDGSSSNVNIVLYIRGSSDNFAFRYGSRGYNPIGYETGSWVPSDTRVHTYILSPTSLVFDGTTYNFSNSYTNTCGVPLGIFCQTSSGNPGAYSKGKMFYCKIWSGNILVRDFYPAMRKSDNVVGLFDDVSQTFFTNKGSGVFTYGHKLGVVCNPSFMGYSLANLESVEAVPISNAYKFTGWQLDGYTRLEYIQGTGTQYINSDYVPNLNSKFFTKVNPQMISESAIFGSAWALNASFLMFYDNCIRWHSNSAIDVPVSLNNDYIVETGNGFITVNGINYTGATSSSVENYALSIFVATTGNRTVGQFKLYYLRIEENDIVVRNFIPVIRHSDGAIGLLDLVHLKFYGNNGTGEFIGGDVYAS